VIDRICCLELGQNAFFKDLDSPGGLNDLPAQTLQFVVKLRYVQDGINNLRKTPDVKVGSCGTYVVISRLGIPYS
jgi:hypothetical protein